jgi:hypothetical protein
MAKVALKLINCAQFQREEGLFWTADEKDAHTLHFAVSLPDSFSPTLARYFIHRYTGKKDTVLDPFCGRGTTPLEAVLMERRALASDVNPIFSRVAAAKLDPVDLVDAAMFLQGVNFSRPVSLEGYNECFSAFFDPDTYREIVNLKSAIAVKYDSAARFVEMITLSILHGHTAGYLSSYALPQVSVSPDHQRAMNDRRGQSPEYRSVAPRVLKKVGLVMRDGDKQRIRDYSESGAIRQADARNLSHIPSSSVNLVLAAPPRPNSRAGLMDQWLRGWFCGLTTKDQKACMDYSFASGEIANWCDFMNSVMFELARVVKSGGYAAFELGSELDCSEYRLDEVFKDLIEMSLSSYWEADTLVVNKPQVPQLTGRAKTMTTGLRDSRVLVLRRK